MSRRLLSLATTSLKQFAMAAVIVVAGQPTAAGAEPSVPAASERPPLTAEQRAQAMHVQRLARQMNELFALAKFEQAIPVTEELVESCQELLGEQNAQTAFAIHQLGWLYHTTGREEEAKRCSAQAVAIRRKVLGDKHSHTALSLGNLALAQFSLGEYEEALACQKEALEIHREAGAQDRRHTAILLLEIAKTYSKLSATAEAEEHFRQAIKLQEAVLGEGPQLAETLYFFGEWLAEEVRHVEVRPVAERALAIQRKSWGRQAPQLAPTLIVLGRTCLFLNDTQAAEEALQEALAICLREFGQNHLSTAMAHHVLSDLRFSQGDYGAAHSAAVKALASVEGIPGEHSDYLVSMLDGMANIEEKLGNQVAAKAYFEKAVSVADQAYGAGSVSGLPSRIGLAACLASLGDHRGAWLQFQQADEIVRDSLPPEDLGTAHLYHELGGFLNELGMYPRARQYLEAGLRIRWKVFGPQHPRTTNTLESLARSYAWEGNYKQANEYFTRALTLREKVFPAEHPQVAAVHQALGYVDGRLGNYAEAIVQLEKALVVLRKHLGENHPAVANNLNNLAVFQAELGNLDRAAALADQSRKSVRGHMSTTLAMLGEREQLQYLVAGDRTLHDSLSLGIRGQRHPQICTLSAEWLLNSKALAQEVLTHRSAIARESTDAQVHSIAEHLRAVRAQQATQILAGLRAGAEQASATARDNLLQKEESLSRQLAEALENAAASDPWVTLDSVRQRLAPHETFINIALVSVRDFSSKTPGEPARSVHYAAWIVPALGQGDVKTVDLGSAEQIDEAILAMRTALAHGFAINEETGRATSINKEALLVFHGASARLSELVLHPLVERVARTTQSLSISPDAGLWLVPWHALLLRDGRFAVEQYQIRHLTSGREILAPKRSYPLARPMIVADPAFDLDQATAARITKDVLGGGKLTSPREASVSTPRDAKIKRIAVPLPDSEQDIKVVASHLARYAGKFPAMFTARHALEGLVKAVHHPSVAVFHTHGFFNPALVLTPEELAAVQDGQFLSDKPAARLRTENPLLLGGLLLAGCNQPKAGPGDDGILTGMEIAGLDLRGTKLVMLSACDTGVGQARIGEGVASVRQAFQLAGAETVVASLWTVTVEQSTQQMSEFFSHLAAGRSAAEALRESQLAAIERLKKKYGVAPPLLWAAFTATGK